MISDKISILKDMDTYSLTLFVLYKLTGVAEYSSLSELAYVLDKDNLLNLLEYFGGTTIKIPTVSEFENLVYALLLYEYVNIDHKEYKEACKLLNKGPEDLIDIKATYRKLCNILEKYEFSPRESLHV